MGRVEIATLAVAARAKERKKEKGEGKGRKNTPFSLLSLFAWYI